MEQGVYLFLLCGELDDDIWTYTSGRILEDTGEKVQCLSSLKNVNNLVFPVERASSFEIDGHTRVFLESIQ